MRILISGGIIVNEGRSFPGSLVISDDRITDIIKGAEAPRGDYDESVDATGCLVLPGIIDDHVHLREPGLTEKADIESETRAAACGGVTSCFDMPNTIPQTTTQEALCAKYALAREKSHINYSFFFGATNDNSDDFRKLDRRHVPGIKLFMGASTGNMLVDRRASLLRIFDTAAQCHLPVMAHCEDSAIINRNMEQMKESYGDDPPVSLHPLVRSEEACYASSALAVQMAQAFGTRLHLAHITTKKELSLVEPVTADDAVLPKITLEACVAHLIFSSEDYATKGTLIKCNPAVKCPEDRAALREALTDGRITVIATDHAPHLLSQKRGGCVRATSGMPMVQFSLVAMLELVDNGVMTVERMVELMAHNPARLFRVVDRGYLRTGYKADLVIVRPDAPWTLTEEMIQSKCGWSPLTGHTFSWRVEHTFCNGHHIYNKGVFDAQVYGERIEFEERDSDD